MKVCTECNSELSLSCFSKNKSSKDGLQNKCKACFKSRYEKTKEHVRAYGAKYRLDNKSKIAEKDRKYRELNRDKTNAVYNNYRARSAGANGSFDNADWKARLDYYGSKCVYCGCEGKMTKDHRVPLSRGGSNWPSNLVPACQSCNSSKGAMTESEYRATLCS